MFTPIKDRLCTASLQNMTIRLTHVFHGSVSHLFRHLLAEVDWKMFMLIKSSAGRPAIRELLRRTWATLSYVNRAQFRSIFVIGKANRNQQLIIDEEAKRYGDILQLNVSDDYRYVESER